jgi:hypothetical protein
MRGCSHLKEGALNRTMWRAGFGRGVGPVLRQTNKRMNEPERLEMTLIAITISSHFWTYIQKFCRVIQMPTTCALPNMLPNSRLLHCDYNFCSLDYSTVLTDKTPQCQSPPGLNTGPSNTVPGITLTKETFKEKKKERSSFHQQMGLKFKEK